MQFWVIYKLGYGNLGVPSKLRRGAFVAGHDIARRSAYPTLCRRKAQTSAGGFAFLAFCYSHSITVPISPVLADAPWNHTVSAIYLGKSEVTLGKPDSISHLFVFATSSYEAWNSHTVVNAVEI